MARDDALFSLAERVGLDRASASRALQDAGWREAAEANRRALFDLGLWGVPTFALGGLGFWGRDRLEMAAALAAASAREVGR